jgi:hypothetical protein
MFATGCATATSEPVTPTLYEYTAEEQAQAADELDTLGPGSMLGRMITDYGAVRAEIRAMEGVQ